MRSIVAACAIGVVGVACGGDPEPAPATGSEPTAARGFSEAREVAAAPVIERVRLEPREPARDEVVRAVVSARDPNGDPVELDYRWRIDGTPQRWGEESLELAGVRKGAVVEVEVTASDGSLRSDPARAEVSVIDRPPALTALTVDPPEEVAPGSPVKAQADASDPDGDRVRFEYRWLVNGEASAERGDVFVAEDLQQGDTIQVEVRAGDGTSWTRPKRSAPVRVGSAHPEITSRPPGFRGDGVFRYAVEAEDPDGDRLLRYRLDEAPDGMVIDSVLGEVSWRPAEGQTGVHPVKVVVRDSSGLETSQSFRVTVREASEDDAAEEARAAPPAAGP